MYILIWIIFIISYEMEILVWNDKYYAKRLLLLELKDKLTALLTCQQMTTDQ